MTDIQQAPVLPVVAAFDFDGTMTHGESLFTFLWFSLGTWRFVRKLAKLPTVLFLRLLAGFSPLDPKEAILECFLTGMSRQQLEILGDRYARIIISKRVKPDALARLRWHRQRGDCCVLISASPDVYLSPWGKDMGFDAVLCSRLEYDDNGRFSGRLAGKNCWGPEKAVRLGQWLDYPAIIYAYGDSRGDRELLAMADHAFYRCMPMTGRIA